MAATRSPVTPSGWSVVMPVKGGPAAKTRLAHPLRAALAQAVALDAVSAALAARAVREVVVVTADAGTAEQHARLGARLVGDPGHGLDAALRAGAEACEGTRPCALLLADLPALRPQDLSEVLRACERLLGGRSGAAVTVPDADGSGTVLLAAARPADLHPAFGPGSAAAHARIAHVLTDVPAGVRRDVDTETHLRSAAGLGLGPRTTQVLASQPRSTIAPSDASFSPKRS